MVDLKICRILFEAGKNYLFFVLVQYDTTYLNALGILSPQGLPFNALPFDLSSLSQVAPMGPNSMRDVQNLGKRQRTTIFD